MTQNFADRLCAAILKKRAPCVVGLDSALEALPTDYLAGLGVSLDSPVPQRAEAMVRFNRMVIDSIADLVPAVKPNAAFYEKLGVDGIRALEETISYARERELVVILDAKRGDIGNTAEAYASAYLANSDSLTISPYLGEDSIEPFIAACKKFNSGVFILVRTSNKGATTFQDLEVGGERLFFKVADLVSRLGEELVGESGYSSVGAVVGATWPEDAKLLRKRMPKTLFLVPGFGAQGGDVDTVRACFDANGLGAIVNSSRGILYPKGAGNNYRDAVREACEKFVSDIRTAVGW